MPSIPITNGLVGYYDYKSLTHNAWLDYSTNKNDAIISGVMKNKKSYIEGTTSSAVLFPSVITPPNYTLIHLCRYNGHKSERILQAYDNNWLSGFHKAKTGVAYHDNNKWITQDQQSNFAINEWILSVDTAGTYRANKKNLSNGNKGVGPNRLSLNISRKNGSKENSDWNIVFVIAFNRTQKNI